LLADYWRRNDFWQRLGMGAMYEAQERQAGRDDVDDAAQKR
jgi:hypothetical protein